MNVKCLGREKSSTKIPRREKAWHILKRLSQHVWLEWVGKDNMSNKAKIKVYVLSHGINIPLAIKIVPIHFSWSL